MKIQRGGSLPKLSATAIPFCKDQGIPTVVGAAKVGKSIQASIFVMPGNGAQAVTFAAMGMEDMADGLYAVDIKNQTAAGASTATVKLTTGFTITGPSHNDVLDIVVVGCLKGQLQ